MNFEEYLQSKKIDSAAFKAAEASLWSAWQKEFEQVSSASFTAQKLFLINPVRRKYQLSVQEVKPVVAVSTEPGNEVKKEELPVTGSAAVKPDENPSSEAAKPKPAVARPVFKPKPKIN